MGRKGYHLEGVVIPTVIHSSGVGTKNPYAFCYNYTMNNLAPKGSTEQFKKDLARATKKVIKKPSKKGKKK